MRFAPKRPVFQAIPDSTALPGNAGRSGAAPGCEPCHQRIEAGEFTAGRRRMIDGLEMTGTHTSTAKAPTEFTYFTCRDCGQRWILTEDTSVPGPASRYLSRRRA